MIAADFSASGTVVDPDLRRSGRAKTGRGRVVAAVAADPGRYEDEEDAAPMAIKLNKEMETRSAVSLKRFFKETMEEEIGDLKASLFLDFILREIGPSIYNRAVADVQAYMQDKIVEADGACYEPEFGYWKGK